jgi:sialate O-acetylesterase
MILKNILFSFVLFAAYNACGQISLPKIFSDHMVLQRDKPITIWGTANRNEKIMISFHLQKKNILADKNGRWQLTLANENAGGPYQLIVKGKNTITINDVLVGDVWLCSGQSNMEWPLQATDSASMEIPKANFPSIRHFKVPRSASSSLESNVTGGEWKLCTPANAPEFTAVGYYFAKRLTKDLSIPIGLINSTWGGTQIESWISADAFAQDEEFKHLFKGMKSLDLDSLVKAKANNMLSKIKSMQGELPQNAVEAASWKNADIDDKSWPEMSLPLIWEAQGLADFDGVVWYRRKVFIDAPAKSAAKISLSMIDDSDETFVNGIKVGETRNKWNEQRSYQIPAGVLKEGENIIAVRVEDTGGGGGIYGDSSLMKLTYDDKVISLAGKWKFKVESILSGQSINPNSSPTILYNAMVNPLIQYNIKGFLWYQGETNVSRAYQYRKTFPLLIKNWRSKWKQDGLPFYYVQLATFNENNGNSENGSAWAELREAQALTLSVPHTGMATTTDIGDPKDIHPRNKRDVGERLALLALHRTYAKDILDTGPVLKSFEIKDDKIIITFDQSLVVRDKYGYVRGLELAADNKKFVPAKAEANNNVLVVWTKDITRPVAVRYGWADDASECNLFNAEGLPVAPFRTDQRKGITHNTKFSF